MKITKYCFMTGKDHTKDLNITEEQIANWHKGMLIQHAMPHLTDSEREFLMSGLSDEGWNQLFKDTENE